MGRRTKASRHTKTLKKNILLFFLSITILAGTSWLFINIVELPGLPFKIDEIKPLEVISAIKARFGKNVIDDRHIAENDKNSKKKAEASAAVEKDYKYSFYDILYHQKQPKSADNHFSVQIDIFKSRKSAEDFAKELESGRRLTCRIVKKGSHYSVLWGGFPSRSTAERYNRQLSGMLGRECLVVEM
ncbi:MAG TPA: SPOR domain-containing protein [Desulfomonilia bacterium]